MFGENQQSQPNIYGPYTSQPRDIWYSNANFGQYVAPPVIIDGTLSSNPLNAAGAPGTPGDYKWLLWAGMTMGRITATNKWRNSVIGVATANFSSTTITASSATVGEVARLITLNSGSPVSLVLTGAPTANGAVASVVSNTVSATAASGTSITLASNSTTYIAQTLIQPADGSQTFLGYLADDRNVVLVDAFFNRVDAQTDRIAIAGGTINTGMVTNYPTDTGIKGWWKNQLTAFSYLDNIVV